MPRSQTIAATIHRGATPRPVAASRIAIAACFISLSCATAPRPSPESATAPAPRIKDSAPEKIAAQRAASGLQLEEDDQRWGVDAARERRREAKAQNATAATTATAGAGIVMPPPTGHAPAPP